MNPQSPPSPSVKKPVRKLTVLCYLFWMGIAGFLVATCGEKKGGASADSAATEKPFEYKLAYLDSGEEAAGQSATTKRYRRVLDELAQRFEITDKEIGNMTRVVVKDLEAEHGIKTTMIEMMESVLKVSSKDPQGNLLGKGIEGYSYALASLSVLMLPEKP